MADSLSFYCPSLTWPTKDWLSFCDVSYFNPTSFNLLSSYCLFLAKSLSFPSNSTVRLLKSSISATNLETWAADNLSFSWLSLTCPAKSLFSPVRPSSLFLNSLSSFDNLEVSVADNRSFSWASLTCPAKPWLSLCEDSYFIPNSFNLFSSYCLFRSRSCFSRSKAAVLLLKSSI